VVIVNWNGAEDTLECLRSVLGLDAEDGAADADLRVIVIDNGSTDGSLEGLPAALAAWGVRVEVGTLATAAQGPVPDTPVWLLSAGEKLGFAAGCNAGMSAATRSGHSTSLSPGAAKRSRKPASSHSCGSPSR
jgi:GT2 family glycosyltransferase